MKTTCGTPLRGTSWTTPTEVLQSSLVEPCDGLRGIGVHSVGGSHGSSMRGWHSGGGGDNGGAAGGAGDRKRSTQSE